MSVRFLCSVLMGISSVPVLAGANGGSSGADPAISPPAARGPNGISRDSRDNREGPYHGRQGPGIRQGVQGVQ